MVLVATVVAARAPSTLAPVVLVVPVVLALSVRLRLPGRPRRLARLVARVAGVARAVTRRAPVTVAPVALVVSVVTVALVVLPSRRVFRMTASPAVTLAPVALDVKAMRRVVEQVGGCIVWGGAVQLSPADDILIRVFRGDRLRVRERRDAGSAPGRPEVENDDLALEVGETDVFAPDRLHHEIGCDRAGGERR